MEEAFASTVAVVARQEYLAKDRCLINYLMNVYHPLIVFLFETSGLIRLRREQGKVTPGYFGS